MSLLEHFSEITKADEPLAPLTWMKTGGVAQYVVTPRNQDELQKVVAWCNENETPIRVLGGGSSRSIGCFRQRRIPDRASVLRVLAESSWTISVSKSESVWAEWEPSFGLSILVCNGWWL